jgi:hypothetical protein
VVDNNADAYDEDAEETAETNNSDEADNERGNDRQELENLTDVMVPLDAVTLDSCERTNRKKGLLG